MGRGPSYPYVGLEEAIGLTRKMYDYTKRAPAAAESVITEAWKYSPSSSGSQKVLAALRAFGLVEDLPGSNGKSIKISQRSVRILLDSEDSAERKDEIRKAALAPKWYEFCWRTWGKELPASMRSSLLIEHGFVDTTVEGFLKDYRKTIAFAGLMNDPLVGKTAEGSPPEVNSSDSGDYVQWESQAASPIDSPKPSEQSSATAPTISKPVTQGGAIMLQETFSLPDGRAVNIQWPASFTPEAYEDFTAWLEIVKRKIGRTVKVVVPSSDEKAEPEGVERPG